MEKAALAAIITSGLTFTALPSLCAKLTHRRGFQHDKVLRKVIRSTVNSFKNDLFTPLFENLGLKTTYAEYQKFFMKETGLLKTTKEQHRSAQAEIERIFTLVKHDDENTTT